MLIFKKEKLEEKKEAYIARSASQTLFLQKLHFFKVSRNKVLDKSEVFKRKKKIFKSSCKRLSNDYNLDTIAKCEVW